MNQINSQRLFTIILTAVLFFGCINTTNAKRSAPPGPFTIIFKNSIFETSTNECGLVNQINLKTGKVIRNIRFYRVFYWPFLEKDVQDVWIKDIFHLGDELWARDEKNRIYKMLFKTLNPKRIEYLSEKQFEEFKQKAEQANSSAP